MNKQSFFEKVLCRPYNGARKLESKVSNGFATINQKVTLIGLEVVVPYKNNDIFIDSGDKIYVKKEDAHNKQLRMSAIFKCEDNVVDGDFCIVDVNDIIFVARKQ